MSNSSVNFLPFSKKDVHTNNREKNCRDENQSTMQPPHVTTCKEKLKFAMEVYGFADPFSITDLLLKKKFRELSRKYHPDKNFHDSLANERFHLIHEQYILLDEFVTTLKHFQQNGTINNSNADELQHDNSNEPFHKQFQEHQEFTHSYNNDSSVNKDYNSFNTNYIRDSRRNPVHYQETVNSLTSKELHERENVLRSKNDGHQTSGVFEGVQIRSDQVQGSRGTRLVNSAWEQNNIRGLLNTRGYDEWMQTDEDIGPPRSYHSKEKDQVILYADPIGVGNFVHLDDDRQITNFNGESGHTGNTLYYQDLKEAYSSQTSTFRSQIDENSFMNYLSSRPETIDKLKKERNIPLDSVPLSTQELLMADDIKKRESSVTSERQRAMRLYQMEQEEMQRHKEARKNISMLLH